MPISSEDRDFIRELLEHELDSDKMDLLDSKLINTEFKQAYEDALSEKYDNKRGKLLGYIPMIVLGILVILGVFLVLNII